MEILQKVVEEFSQLDYIDAICLSGSRTGKVFDESSDFDIYIYSSKPVDIEFRQKFANQYALKAEVGNDFFGDGDELILPNNIGLDLMYRNTNWLSEEISRVWDSHQVGVGYSTAFLYNIKTSKILFDRTGLFEAAQKRLETPYPQALTDAIIKKNYPLLKSKLCASFYEQIQKAILRKDFVSVNHRTAAFLASYFDVLFALNKVLHPGEKKLIQFVLNSCEKIPENFETNVNAAVTVSSEEKLQALDKLLDGLILN